MVTIMTDKLVKHLEDILYVAERQVEAHDLNQFASNDLEYIEGKAYQEGQVDIVKFILTLIKKGDNN